MVGATEKERSIHNCNDFVCVNDESSEAKELWENAKSLGAGVKKDEKPVLEVLTDMERRDRGRLQKEDKVNSEGLKKLFYKDPFIQHKGSAGRRS